MRQPLQKKGKDAHKVVCFAFVLDSNCRFALFLGDLERPVFHITFDVGIVNLATDQTFDIKDSVFRVRMSRVPRSVPDPRKEVSPCAMSIRADAYNRPPSVKETQDGVIR